MTKDELIKALSDSRIPGDWGVFIVKKEWIPGAEYPLEEQFPVDQVAVIDQGEVGIEFYSNEPTE